VAAIVSLKSAKELMILQDAWFTVIKGPIPLNFILFLFLWGIAADRYSKTVSQRKGWLIWGIGTAVILMAYRFLGGYGTLFG